MDISLGTNPTEEEVVIVMEEADLVEVEAVLDVDQNSEEVFPREEVKEEAAAVAILAHDIDRIDRSHRVAGTWIHSKEKRL